MKLKNSGYITVTSTLVLSVIFMSIAITVARQAVSEAAITSSFNKRDIARNLASSCLNYARMELQRTLDYRGNQSILMDAGTCEIFEIKGFGNEDRVLQVQGVSGDFIYRIEDSIEAISPKMKFFSSKRVISFN